eukprot:maker-scaffold193_size270907-snap-gene-1.19 protein:Tk01091 transcript:maker-scaffold193_size270907-snap-gene-1.19-mRNA-1 annotation:"Neurotrimin"
MDLVAIVKNVYCAPSDLFGPFNLVLEQQIGENRSWARGFESPNHHIHPRYDPKDHLHIHYSTNNHRQRGGIRNELLPHRLKNPFPIHRNKRKVPSGSKANEKADEEPYNFYGRPFFAKTQTDVLVQEGSHAFFHCIVHNLGNQTVSWVRNADSHILFIGRDRFVHEDRYELIPARHGSWTLKLKYVSARDAGKFECQVSTVPKISQTYALKVVVPSVKIMGDREVHVKSGTSVSLRCLISNVLEEPSYVFWYKEDKRLLSGEDGNITITTKRIVGDGAAVSTITIAHPDPSHSGIYCCRPANLERAFVSLHVIQDEKPAAMQHEKQAVAAIAEASASTGSRGFEALPVQLFVSLTLTALRMDSY